MKKERYPTGHPIRITENFKDISEYFGLAKIKILAPRGLRIPVLPDRSTGQLVFSLCYSCSVKKQKICDHSENERAFTGTWVTVEIEEALKQGYKILKIYEVLNYETSSKYDPNTRTGGLFTSYINQFLKMKAEASGYPPGITTDSLKEKYINDYLLVEGILLDKENIKYNEGMRAIAKLMLNSFWGRFGMQTNKSQFKFIRNTSEWFSLISDPRYVVVDVDFTHKNYLQVYYVEKNDYYESIADVNVVIACFTCAYGRLKMLFELTKLDDRVLYMDTDSIIFLSKPGYYEPKLGDYLGDFTDEINKQGEGDFIQKFVSGGAKNYAFITKNGISKAIVKGFSLNNVAIQSINYDSMEKIVTEDQNETLTVEQLVFNRDKINWKNSTCVINKKYRFFFTKRCMLNNYSTLPWGY